MLSYVIYRAGKATIVAILMFSVLEIIGVARGGQGN